MYNLCLILFDFSIISSFNNSLTQFEAKVDVNKLLFSPKKYKQFKSQNYKPGYEEIVDIIRTKYKI